MAKGEQNKLSFSKVAQKLREGTPCELQDGGALFLIVTGKNRGRWEYRGRVKGSRKHDRFPCGKAPETSLSEARTKRDEIRLALSQGIDLKAREKEAKQAAQREKLDAVHTFEAVARERHAKKDAGRGDYGREKMQKLEKHVFPFIGAVPVSRLERRQLIAVLDPLHDRPSTAKKICSYINQVCEYALVMDYAQADPSAHLRSTLPTMPPVRHFPHLEGERAIGLFCLAVDDYPGWPSTRYALKLALLIGDALRSEALRNSKWGYIDLEKGLWKVPKGEMKVKAEGYTVALPRQAISLLKELQEIYPHTPEALVFPSGLSGKSLSENTLNQAIRRMGYTKEQLVFHGIRGTFSTWANTQRQQGDTRFDPDLIEKCLAHKGRGDVRFSYDHSDPLEARRQVLQLWADALDDMARKAEGKKGQQDEGRE